MKSTHITVEKELHKSKQSSTPDTTMKQAQTAATDEIAKKEIYLEPNSLKKKPDSTLFKMKVSHDDVQLLSQNLSGPQLILNNIDNAIDTLKSYVENAKTSLATLVKARRAAQKKDDSITEEFKQNISNYFSLLNESEKLTNQKIKIVEDAIGNILVIKSDLADCNEFTAENINDPMHPMTAVLYYLYILINEHTELLKEVFKDINIDKLGNSLGSAVNHLLGTPLQYIGWYTFSGKLDRTLNTLAKSITLEYPVQASAAKKALEDEMMTDAKNTLIPSHIKRLDHYIQETSSQLRKTNTDDANNLTSGKLKIAIDLRTKLKYLEKHPLEEKECKMQSGQPDPTLYRVATHLLEAAQQHEKLTGAVIPSSINSYLGTTFGEWVNYFFSSIFIAAGKYSYQGRLGYELRTTMLSFDTQFPGVIDIARTRGP